MFEVDIKVTTPRETIGKHNIRHRKGCEGFEAAAPDPKCRACHRDACGRKCHDGDVLRVEFTRKFRHLDGPPEVAKRKAMKICRRLWPSCKFRTLSIREVV